MEIKTAFQAISKRLEDFNASTGFTMVKDNGVKENEITVFSDGDVYSTKYTGKRGTYKIQLNVSTDILVVEASEDQDDEAEYKEVSKSLFEVESADDREIKSIGNEIIDSITPIYKSRDRKDLDKIKLPRSATKSAVKNGYVSYNEVDLATRFADALGLKDEAKGIMSEYDELLPETFFIEYGTPLIMDALRTRNEEKLKKIFKLLNDIYENGTNSAQDLIVVTIMGEMKNDPVLIETADKYMCEYMTGAVHEVNKILSKSKYTNKLKNPPPYKPKKEKKPGMMSSLMGGGGPQQ